MIALLDQIHQNMSLLLTWALQDGVQALSEIRHIRDFLVLEEHGLEEEKLTPETPLEANTAVNIEDFSAAWTSVSMIFFEKYNHLSTYDYILLEVIAWAMLSSCKITQ